jgi:hypothetical protein
VAPGIEPLSERDEEVHDATIIVQLCIARFLVCAMICTPSG